MTTSINLISDVCVRLIKEISLLFLRLVIEILLVAEFSNNHSQGAVSMIGRVINKIKFK